MRLAKHQSRIHPSARLGAGVKVGRGVIIEAHAIIGEGTHLGPDVYIGPHTQIGRHNRFEAECVIGSEAQIRHAASDSSGRVLIGDANRLGTRVTIHRSSQATEPTRLGHHNRLMAHSHLAHDCQVADRVYIGKRTAVGGHVHISDEAHLEAGSAVHQFVSIGKHAYLKGGSAVIHDVPPYLKTDSHGRIIAFNPRILKSSIPPHTLKIIARAYHWIYVSPLVMKEALGELEKMAGGFPELDEIISFLKRTRRAVARTHTAFQKTLTAVA